MPEFDSAHSLGALPRAEIGAYLTEIRDMDAAAEFNRALAAGQAGLFAKRPYIHKGLILGYIAPSPVGPANAIPVQGVSKIGVNSGLIGQRIKITMDKFYVRNYPGTGTHKILCEFAGKNQVAGETEELRFALRFEVQDRGSAGITGAPIFMGVTVGKDGISFEGRTVNLSSKNDETILSALDSPAFKSGLSLIEYAQPALKPFTGLAKAVVQSVCTRSNNRQVHNFNLGLDFSDNATSARLALGSYIVVQADPGPDQPWDWSHYVWNADAMSLQPNDPQVLEIDFNYMVFAVRPFSDEVAAPKPAKRGIRG
jgi:hypothetical protein